MSHKYLPIIHYLLEVNGMALSIGLRATQCGDVTFLFPVSLTLFYQKDLEANCGALRIQITVLQDQNTALQVKLENHTDRLQNYFAGNLWLKRRRVCSGSGFSERSETKCAALRTELAVLLEQKQNLETQLRQSNSNANNSRGEYTAKGYSESKMRKVTSILKFNEGKM